MPELPEVETMRRGIAPVIGNQITTVQFPRCRLKPINIWPSARRFRQGQRGRAITSVGRRGKRVLLHLEGGMNVIIEPRMTGLVLLTDPPNLTHLRVTWKLRGAAPNGLSLSFWDRRGLGTLALVNDRQLAERLGADRLGPDALDLNPARLERRLSSSRRPIKVALLDQKAIAGIGNLYASEILHLARIHPCTPCNRLVQVHWKQLHEALERVLTEAIRFEGSTLSDGTYRNALNRQGTYQNQHRVYDRAGQLCPTCQQTPIMRLVQAQRSTFWCPVCQQK